MKYKLINNTTGEEHICSKVVIDGFDYYVSDDELVNGDIIIYPLGCEPPQYIHLRKVTNTHSHGGKELCDTYLSESAYIRFEWSKKVIATNNPSIDLPKVVDEIEILSQLEFPVSISKGKWGLEDVVQDFNKRAFTKGYNKSQESHPFSEKDMIEFTEWIVEEWTPNGRRGCWDSRELNSKFEPKYLVDSTKQLLQIWKEQRIKTIYYEQV